MQGFFYFFLWEPLFFLYFHVSIAITESYAERVFLRTAIKRLFFCSGAGLLSFFLQMLKSSASTVTKVTLPGGASISLLTLLNELLLNPHLAFHLDETHSDTRLNILNRLGVVTKFRPSTLRLEFGHCRMLKHLSKPSYLFRLYISTTLVR